MKIADICEKASSNIALNKIQNIDGDYPIYGASGYIKNVNFYHRDRAYIGIVKDGSGVGRVNTYPPMLKIIRLIKIVEKHIFHENFRRRYRYWDKAVP